MTATKNQPKLPSFEDHDVQSAAVRIVKCGDGLSEALKVEPKALELGDEVSFVLTGRVSQINHKDNDGVIQRLHTVETTAITEIDGGVAKKMLTEAADELEKAKAEAQGQLLLDAENEATEREAKD